MQYSIDYQYMPKGASRPHDDGVVVGIDATDKSGAVILPNVGDYVNVARGTAGGVTFQGKVRSRLFTYLETDVDKYCTINIVVEEVDDDWGKLIKE